MRAVRARPGHPPNAVTSVPKPGGPGRPGVSPASSLGPAAAGGERPGPKAPRSGVRRELGTTAGRPPSWGTCATRHFTLLGSRWRCGARTRVPPGPRHRPLAAPPWAPGLELAATLAGAAAAAAAEVAVSAHREGTLCEPAPPPCGPDGVSPRRSLCLVSAGSARRGDVGRGIRVPWDSSFLVKTTTPPRPPASETRTLSGDSRPLSPFPPECQQLLSCCHVHHHGPLTSGLAGLCAYPSCRLVLKADHPLGFKAITALSQINKLRFRGGLVTPLRASDTG